MNLAFCSCITGPIVLRLVGSIIDYRTKPAKTTAAATSTTQWFDGFRCVFID